MPPRANTVFRWAAFQKGLLATRLVWYYAFFWSEAVVSTSTSHFLILWMPADDSQIFLSKHADAWFSLLPSIPGHAISATRHWQLKVHFIYADLLAKIIFARGRDLYNAIYFAAFATFLSAGFPMRVNYTLISRHFILILEKMIIYYMLLIICRISYCCLRCYRFIRYRWLIFHFAISLLSAYRPHFAAGHAC